MDDLPAAGELHPALIALADDFAAHGYDLHRLIRVIAATEAFRLDSAAEDAGEMHEADWAVFPMTRLRPEQVAGALFQSASLTTLGPQSHWFARLVAYTGRNDFVRRYGDTGEDEFDARAGTIPQRLLLMNGEIVREQLKDGLLSASSSIAGLAPDDRKAVETAYLIVLTRRPTPEESAHFAGRLAGTIRRRAEATAQRPLLDVAQYDRVLVESLSEKSEDDGSAMRRRSDSPNHGRIAIMRHGLRAVDRAAESASELEMRGVEMEVFREMLVRASDSEQLVALMDEVERSLPPGWRRESDSGEPLSRGTLTTAKKSRVPALA